MDVLYEAVRLLVLTTISFLVAILSTPFWVKILKQEKWYKKIRDRKEAPIYNRFHQKKAGTITAGGVIIWTTVLGLAFLFFVFDFFGDGIWGYFNFVDRRQTYLPIAAMALAAYLGLFDDWLGVRGFGGGNGKGLKVRYKLIIYTFIASLGAIWFYSKLWSEIYIPFIGLVDIGIWYIPFFIFIIVGTAFSANETDGLDGLLGGVALFAYAALTTVAFVKGRYDLAVFGGMIIGALLAFLWFNIYPAKFFMGDTGSMSLGITMGVIAMLTNTELFLPFFAFIMVLESLSVIIQLISRKLKGKKVFLSTPLHHHFEALGWPESQITMRFWIISVIAAGLGLVIFSLSRFFELLA